MSKIIEFTKKISRTSKLVGAIFLFTIFTILLASILDMSMTGFSIFDSEKIIYTNSIRETYYDYAEILLDTHNLENNLSENYSIVSITSIKINGLINGSASIYITDGKKTYLVASSDSKKDKGLNLITGLSIDESISPEESVLIEEKTEDIVIDEIFVEENINEISDIQTSNLSNITETISEIIVLNDEEIITVNETNYTYEILMPTLTELISECVDSCNVNLEKNTTLIIAVESGYVYLYSVEIGYVLEEIKNTSEKNIILEENAPLEEDVLFETNTSNTTKKLLSKTLDEQSKTIVSQKLSDVKVDKILKNEYESEDTFEVYIEDKKNKKNKLVLNELSDINQIDNIKFISKEEHKQEEISTDIIYVNSVNISNATITIYSENSIDAISICKDYNPEDNSCSAWSITTIPFIYENNLITFTVEHFTGYGGVVVSNNRLYATSTTSTTGSTALISLSSVQDETVNMVNFTLASSNLYNFINASTGPLTGRMIRTTDMINFSSYWDDGSRVDFAYATFKLYKNESGVLSLICQDGDDSTGGIQIPEGAVGLRYGNCTPSSDIQISNGSNLIYVINVWAQTIGGGGAATKVASLQWDTATANTSFNYTYIIPTEINISTNQSNYYPSQSVNSTGVYYWLNLSNVVSGNVSVDIFNTSSIRVYQGNTTTSSIGFYSVNYTLPSNADLGTWTVNVTGVYNSTINATNGTTFVVSLPPSTCQDITSPGVFSLLNSVQINSSNCFNVYSPDVQINCAGYSINGNDTLNTYGIYTNSTNTSIVNCSVNSFNNGIYFDAGAHNGSIINVSIYTNSSNSIALFILSSNSVNIRSVNITSNSSLSPVGMYVENSNDVNITTSRVSINGSSGVDIEIINSVNFSLTNSNLTGDGANNILINGSNLGYFTNNLLSTKNINQLSFSIYNSNNLSIYYNNFTGTGKWVNLTNSNNIEFNTSIANKAQGNHYPNTTSYRVYDTDLDGYADTGIDYPFNETTLGNTVWNGNGSDFGPATTRTITTIGARISPINSTASQDLIGYCNGTESTSVNVSYVYTWYNNSVLFSTGITSQNWTSGLEINVANLSSTNLVATHNWTLSCRASVNGANATEINSSASTIQSEANSAPIISDIVPTPSIDPLEESDRIIQFNFTVMDLDGNDTINISSARTYVNYSAYTRSSSECSGFAINATSVNVSCNLSMKYYDPAGIWSINISISDNSNAYTQNISTTFTYNILTAVSINSNLFEFGNASAGTENITTTSPVIIRNTGNSNFSFVRVKGYDLENSTNFVGVGNISINSSNISTGYALSNDTFINIADTPLVVSNDTYNSTISLYMYADVPIGIPALRYNSIISWVANLIS